MSDFYQRLFPTRLSAQRQAVQDFATTANGFRLSTSVGGVLTGRGADYILVDDALKADESLSDSRRKAVNTWFAQTLFSRLNSKQNGCIVVLSQRLHEDDLAGYLLANGGWKLLRFPAIAEEDETYTVQTPYGTRVFQRRAGEALHPQRESFEVLKEIREKMGEYAFAAQYQQSPAPLGGGMVQAEWFKRYSEDMLPKSFDMVVQSLDSANKASELNDYSVITTWGIKDKNVYLVEVFWARLEYPDLKRAVTQFAARYRPKVLLIEDRASGTQLIQELRREGVHAATAYDPKGLEKKMRLRSVSSTIEGGFVFLPEKAPWLADYLYEITTFPNGKYDDQVDSTSQALDWIKERDTECWFYTQCRERAEKLQKRDREAPNFRNLHEWKNW